MERKFKLSKETEEKLKNTPGKSELGEQDSKSGNKEGANLGRKTSTDTVPAIIYPLFESTKTIMPDIIKEIADEDSKAAIIMLGSWDKGSNGKPQTGALIAGGESNVRRLFKTLLKKPGIKEVLIDAMTEVEMEDEFNPCQGCERQAECQEEGISFGDSDVLQEVFSYLMEKRYGRS